MYKLIAVDLDGTLLNSYGLISDRNKEYIKKAIEAGIEVVLASGRTVSSVKSFADEIGANNYMICGNGSILYDIKNEEIVYDKFIDKRKVLEIIRICEENSIYYNVYTENLTIAKLLNYNVLFYNNENKNKEDGKKTNIKIVSDIYSYIEQIDNLNVLKMTICDENEIIFTRIIKRLREVQGIDVLDVSHMTRKTIRSGTEDFSIEYFYTEITRKDVNKWNTLRELANMLNIKKDEIVAIGDNINDKEMIENAGLGVIMANSAPYMKRFANVEVADNNNDGVAEAIEKYVLE